MHEEGYGELHTPEFIKEELSKNLKKLSMYTITLGNELGSIDMDDVDKIEEMRTTISHIKRLTNSMSGVATVAKIKAERKQEEG